MNREEFMRQLERLLWEIPVNDREDAIAYYNDYFDEAGIENEVKVIKELGSPEKVAAVIKSDLKTSGNDYAKFTEYGYSDDRYTTNSSVPVPKEDCRNSRQKKNIPWFVIILLVIFASPLLLGVGTGIFGVLIGLIAAFFGVIVSIMAFGFGFLIAGIVCFVAGIFRIVTNPLEGFLTTGVGALLTAAGILITLLFIWMIRRWIPTLIRICINFCQKIFHNGERGTVG